MLVTARGLALTLAVLAALAVRDAGAQQPLTLRGTVVRQTVGGAMSVAREPVTLHRVSAREAGPVDSAVTDARGRYSFRVSVPDSQSMYLVSARYAGIAYFSAPAQAGSPAEPSEIVVFDTTSGEVPLQLQGRHVILSAPSAEGNRSVIDVLEIENDTVFTRVAGASNRPTYAVLLPDGARNVRASSGEQGEGTVEVRDGRANLFAPLSPGLRQVVLTYDLSPDAFPLAIPLEREVGVLEVLLEEPKASAAGGGLVSQGGVSVDGKTFTRYLGQNAPANAVLSIAVSRGGGGSSLPAWLLPLALAVVTLGVILVFARRAPAMSQRARAHSAAPVASEVAVATPAPAPDRLIRAAPAGTSAARLVAGDADVVARLARQVAAVDALLEPESALVDAARADLQRYRESLKARLVGALAERARRR